MDTASTVTANQSVAATALAPATGAWLDSAEFHELLMDYRGASATNAQSAYEAIQAYVKLQVDGSQMGSEQFTPEHYARYQAAQNELGPE